LRSRQQRRCWLRGADTKEEARLAEVGREEAARQRAADAVLGELLMTQQEVEVEATTVVLAATDGRTRQRGGGGSPDERMRRRWLAGRPAATLVEARWTAERSGEPVEFLVLVRQVSPPLSLSEIYINSSSLDPLS
jgi:hypothetical protein